MKTRFYVMLVALIMMSSKNVYAQEFHYDVNNDGDVNITDAILVVNYILGKTAEEEKDNAPCEAVDLGLPSGTKWASCNVGATKPEEYGGYYAWGETEEKEYYRWSTYIHCDGSSSTRHDLGSDISGTQYDVAHVKWGGNWCMPTLDDIKELYENCPYEWTTLNGVNGYKFTSKINGNSIFLPAAGYRNYGGLYNAGEYGLYWFGTQYPNNSGDAFALNFYSGFAIWNHYERSRGYSVRPVVRN